jgi:AcrR family transcriptional regulator
VATRTRKAEAEQREELLDAAWTVAAREGLAACTYRRVAAEAGTSTTPLTRQFPSRRELLVALFGKLAAEDDAARSDEAPEGDPLKAVIAEGLEALAGGSAGAARRRVALDMAFEGRSDETIAKRVRARDRGRMARWTGLAEQARKAESIRIDRPVGELVDQLVSLLDGLEFATLIYPERLPAGHVSELWNRGALQLVSAGVSPGVHQRLVIPEGAASRRLLLGDSEVTRRQELLAIAFRVTARDGLAGLSFRALAGEAGTSTTPFTYAFGSRERLLSEMVRAIWAGIFDIRELAAMIPSPVDRLFAEWAAEFSDDREQVDRERVYYALHHEALTDRALAELMLRGDTDGFANSLVLVEAGREQGLVRKDMSPSDLVDTIYALADGIGLRRALLSERRPAGYRVALWEDAGRRILAP